jgi:biotin carboxyl carrier protein
MPEMDLELVRHALQVARRKGFSEIEVEFDDGAFAAKLKPMAPVSLPVVSENGSETAEPKSHAIVSSLVGYYRESSKPLRTGQIVQKGDVVAVVAALGIANEIESKVAGEVVEVLVEPNQPLEYGQPIAMVRPI